MAVSGGNSELTDIGSDMFFVDYRQVLCRRQML